MRSIFLFLLNLCFVFSVLFIWVMLLYQFFLTLGGFLWRQKCRKEERELEKREIELPGVSILIPARNEELVIDQTIRRMLEFDYPSDRMEVIVINDGSTDRTGEIISSWASKDKRIRLFDIPKEESGQGKSAALNKALKVTRFEAVAIFDADNIPERDSLKRLCRSLVADPKLAAVTGKFRAYNRNQTLLTRLVNLESIVFQWTVQAGRWYFLKISALPGTNFVIWKRVVERLGGWDQQALTEDTELTFRIYEHPGLYIKFLPTAVTWEQEPERLKVWVRQRTRWARGNLYIISKYARRIFQRKPRSTAIELINLLYLYYLFIFAILFSDLAFVLSLFGLVHIRVIGPYFELWILAVCLYVLEVMLALSFEREDSFSNLFVAVIAYLTYTKLWVFIVLRSFWFESIRKESRAWDKTQRVDVGPRTN